MHFKAPFLNKEFIYKTSLSGGKGGQNVNKVSTKVQIDFSIVSSLLLSEIEKELLLQKLEGKLSTEGILQVIAQAERTQLGNKEIALKKMYAILNKCFVQKKKRKATKPSKSSIEKRLKSKKHQSQIKQMRKVGED